MSCVFQALADTASLESLSKEELKARVSEVNGKIAEMRAHVSMLTQELSKANQELAKRSPLDVRNSVKLMELQVCVAISFWASPGRH